MNEDLAALADLVGQLLAARWLDEQVEDQPSDELKDEYPALGTLTNRPPEHDVEGDAL